MNFSKDYKKISYIWDKTNMPQPPIMIYAGLVARLYDKDVRAPPEWNIFPDKIPRFANRQEEKENLKKNPILENIGLFIIIFSAFFVVSLLVLCVLIMIYAIKSFKPRKKA